MLWLLLWLLLAAVDLVQASASFDVHIVVDAVAVPDVVTAAVAVVPATAAVSAGTAVASGDDEVLADVPAVCTHMVSAYVVAAICSMVLL